VRDGSGFPFPHLLRQCPSANEAADILGDNVAVADVLVLTRQAGVPLPRPPRAREQAELVHVSSGGRRDCDLLRSSFCATIGRP